MIEPKKKPETENIFIKNAAKEDVEWFRNTAKKLNYAQREFFSKVVRESKKSVAKG